MTPKRAIANLLKYLAQLLPSNRLRSCGAQKTRADKKFGTYFKSADTEITLKGTLTYPMRYTVQILLGVTNDVAGHMKASSSCTWLKYCQEIEVMRSIKETIWQKDKT